MAIGMPMDGPDPASAMTADAPPANPSPYAKAGRLIRHAFADRDDEALGRAICDLVKYENAHGDDGEEGPKEEMSETHKPNLALILASKGKKED